MSYGRYVDRCRSLLCDIFDLPISTSTYRCSHLSKNRGSKAVHLMNRIIYGVKLELQGYSWETKILHCNTPIAERAAPYSIIHMDSLEYLCNFELFATSKGVD